MNILQAIVLAIVEGITEFLPISSTGHMILASNLLAISETNFVKSFEIAIQLGAIAAVAWLYRQEIIKNRKLWPKIILAFVPTAIAGLIFYKIIKNFLLGNVWVTIIALAVGGVFLIGFEKLVKPGQKTIAELSVIDSLLIGLIQAVSMIPGVSRAAATIVGGVAFKLTREEAVKFSFLLAIPTMAAATGLDLLKSGWSFSTNEYLLIGLGTIVAFVTAIFTVEWLVGFVRKHNFTGFGIYRVFLAGVFWWWIKR